MKVILTCAALIFIWGADVASAATVKFEAWCPITGARGTGTGPTASAAKQNAIKSCLANGGLAKCCYKFYRQVS